MNLSKTSLLLVIHFMLGCGNAKKKYVKKLLFLNKHTVTEDQVSFRINKFVLKNEFDQANLYLDSLLLYNKNSGFLYFEKGFIKGLEFKFDEALNDYKKADNLKYKHNSCLRMIKTTTILKNAVENNLR